MQPLVESELRDRSLATEMYRVGRSAEPESELPAVGSLVAGRFLIERELGRGGMGAVFAAVDQRMHNRRVAIKWLLGGAHEGCLSARILREAAASFDHPNVVRIYDVDPEERFLVMELLVGQSLGQRMSQGSFQVREAIEIIVHTLEGLAAVHAHGLVHRDLKPDNIFLARDAKGSIVPKILDFGIVKVSSLLPPPSWPRTREGAVLGTPAYMAPEQERAGTVDARADLYAVSAVLYELLTGRHPRLTPAHGQPRAGQLPAEPTAPRAFRPELSEALERVIMKGLSVSPEDRYQNVQAMLAALHQATPSWSLLGPKRVPKLSLALAALVMVAGAAGSLAWALGGEELPPALPTVAARVGSAVPALPVVVAPALPAGQTPRPVEAASSARAPEPNGARASVGPARRQQPTRELPSLEGLDEEAAKQQLVELERNANQQLEDFVRDFGTLVVPAGSEAKKPGAR